MRLLQYFLLPMLVLVSHFTSFLTYTVVRNVKAGDYVVPFVGWRFESWLPFITVALGVLQPFYWLGGIILFTAYKLSMDSYSDMYPVVILNLAATTFMSVIMMYLRVGEIPNRYGWISLALIFIASYLAIHAGRSITPR